MKHLQCTHRYHLQCILQWAQTARGGPATCPECRRPIADELGPQHPLLPEELAVLGHMAAEGLIANLGPDPTRLTFLGDAGTDTLQPAFFGNTVLGFEGNDMRALRVSRGFAALARGVWCDKAREDFLRSFWDEGGGAHAVTVVSSWARRFRDNLRTSGGNSLRGRLFQLFWEEQEAREVDRDAALGGVE